MNKSDVAALYIYWLYVFIRIEMGFQIYQQLNFSGYEVMKASLQGIFTRLSSAADPAV